MADGFFIRELPDGGSEFVLDDPALAFIRVDDRSSLQFGATELTIASPFQMERDGSTHRLDPRQRRGLGPLLAVFPATVSWLWTSAEGILSVVFRSGATLTVPPAPVVEAWSVGSVHCLPVSPGAPR